VLIYDGRASVNQYAEDQRRIIRQEMNHKSLLTTTRARRGLLILLVSWPYSCVDCGVGVRSATEAKLINPLKLRPGYLYFNIYVYLFRRLSLHYSLSKHLVKMCLQKLLCVHFYNELTVCSLWYVFRDSAANEPFIDFD